MKNLLNCHSIGLHSFPLSIENGLYRRVFVAEENHNLYKRFEIAVHPHHVDIKITVLEGILYNLKYKVDKSGGSFFQYQWNSHIKNGAGGFKLIGKENIALESFEIIQEGESVTMQACELHTVSVNRGLKCAWLIEEAIPTCEYFPINYSIHDLTKWSAEGLYIEVDDTVKEQYITKYKHLI